MNEITAMLYAALGALADGYPVDVQRVLKFAEGELTPELISGGVDLYETLCDVQEL